MIAKSRLQHEPVDVDAYFARLRDRQRARSLEVNRRRNVRGVLLRLRVVEPISLTVATTAVLQLRGNQPDFRSHVAIDQWAKQVGGKVLERWLEVRPRSLKGLEALDDQTSR